MPRKVKTIVITGYGTNCEMEMAHACRLAGADQVDVIHISSLLHGEVKLDDYHFLNLPGGFLDGDDLGSAKAGANRIRYAKLKAQTPEQGEGLYEQFLRFIARGNLILGACNGFQLLVKLGILPGLGGRYDKQCLTLTYNDSGRFENRWVYLKINQTSPCVFTKGVAGLYLPVRHGEGKLVASADAVREELWQKGHVVCQYSDPQYRQAVMEYPANPNGSLDAIAGLTNETGRIFGLMPHPEAYLHYTNHPRWTRETLPEEGMGLRLFRNAVDFIRSEAF